MKNQGLIQNVSGELALNIEAVAGPKIPVFQISPRTVFRHIFSFLLRDFVIVEGHLNKTFDTVCRKHTQTVHQSTMTATVYETNRKSTESESKIVINSDGYNDRIVTSTSTISTSGVTMNSSGKTNDKDNVKHPTVCNVVLDHDIDFGKSPSGKGGPRRVVKAIRPPMKEGRRKE